MKTKTLAAMVLWAGCGVAATLSRPLPPDNVDRGVQLYRDENFRDAERVLEIAIADFPDNLKAWTYLGLARLELDQYEDAATAFRRALSLDGESAEPYYGLGMADAYLGKLDEAIGQLKRATELNPTHAYAHYQLALAYSKKGQIDRALLHLQWFIELEPDAPEAAQVKALLSRLR